jgi:cytidine deaminase
MKKHYFTFSYQELANASELSNQDKMLIDKSRASTSNAYAPYSGFRVGAAALLENGEVITGNNQENAAYPSGMCAERTVLFYAGANYPGIAVIALAVSAWHDGHFVDLPVSPCGSCRQVLLETQVRQKKPFRVLMDGSKAIRIVGDASLLLPFPFDKIG